MMGKTLPGLLVAIALASAVGAQTADDLVARSLDARGGRAAFEAIRSLRMTCRMATGDVRVPLVVEMKRPGRIRIEMAFEGAPSVQAWDGRSAWGIPPLRLDPEALPAEAARQLADQADFEGPLVDHAEKGHAVEVVGRETVDGKAAWKLQVTRKGGQVEHHYLDAGSYLPVRVESRREVRGVVVLAETTLGDYRESGGVLWPFTIRNSVRGRPEAQEITFRSIEANVPIDDERFRMPAAAPKR